MRRCMPPGLVMALTDHDTLEGLAEAADSARAIGLGFGTRVEISVTWGGRPCTSSGWADPDNEELRVGLAGLREFRDWRAQEIGRRLDKAESRRRLPVPAPRRTDRLIVARTFARFLVDNGYVRRAGRVPPSSWSAAKPGFHPADAGRASREAVRWIRLAMDQAVIVHPARYR